MGGGLSEQVPHKLEQCFQRRRWRRIQEMAPARDLIEVVADPREVRKEEWIKMRRVFRTVPPHRPLGEKLGAAKFSWPHACCACALSYPRMLRFRDLDVELPLA